MSFLSFLTRLFRDPHRISATDFLTRRRAREPVLDVRTPREYAQGHLAGALNVDVSAPDFEAQVERLARKGRIEPGSPVYLYCRSGARSGRAVRILREKGFDQAYNVGGFGALRAAGAKVGR